MKLTRIRWLFAIAIAASIVSSTNVLAQGMMGGAPVDPSRGLGRILGRNPAFSATASTVSKETATSTPTTCEFGFAWLDGKSRVEIDLTKSTTRKVDIEGMKTMGMDRLVIVHDPGRKSVLMMYPGLKAYCETTLAQIDTLSENTGVERTELGRETVDGHPCLKSKVKTTEESGKTTESFVWAATDMGNFPIQTEVPTDGGGTSTTLFKDIKNTKPDAALFEAPADFTKYGGMREMIMGAMQKMMQSQ
ncbi:MAG: hypothetical protein EXS18_05400 [Verrucomicrobiae bacterium]|nr:hypothetical protein [Verrucomicrobiae bacterium]